MARRNVLVLLCDQLRPDFLSLYGCPAAPTPNLERLAASGVVFDHAITQSTVCAPSRATMMTGRYVSDHQVWTNDMPFRDGLEYLPQRMNDLGYATGAFGKLHHFPADDAKGFQVVAPMEEGRLGENEPYLQWLRARHPEVTSLWNYENLTFSYDEDEYHEHWIASQAIEFIESADRPFFAWVSFQGPHAPFDPPREVKGACDESAVPEPLERRPGDTPPETVLYRSVREPQPDREWQMARRVAYLEMMVAIDRQIGRILDALEARGVLDETTLLFSADHGDLLADFGLTAKGPFPYHGQLAVPMVVANHPGLPSGTRSDRLVGTIDLPGTVLDIAGDDRPLGHSRSMIAPDSPGREVIFCEFCDSTKVVQDRRWRYGCYPFSGRAELFDRDADPEERVNLAGRPETADVERRMLMHLLDFQLIAKGPRIEAHDLVPEQRRGLAAKDPDWLRGFPVAFPLNRGEVERLRAAGLDPAMNACFEGRSVLRSYAPPYWQS